MQLPPPLFQVFTRFHGAAVLVPPAGDQAHSVCAVDHRPVPGDGGRQLRRGVVQLGVHVPRPHPQHAGPGEAKDKRCDWLAQALALCRGDSAARGRFQCANAADGPAPRRHLRCACCLALWRPPPRAFPLHHLHSPWCWGARIRCVCRTSAAWTCRSRRCARR